MEKDKDNMQKKKKKKIFGLKIVGELRYLSF